jgi:hypothetical protein
LQDDGSPSVCSQQRTPCVGAINPRPVCQLPAAAGEITSRESSNLVPRYDENASASFAPR